MLKAIRRRLSAALLSALFLFSLLLGLAVPVQSVSAQTATTQAQRGIVWPDNQELPTFAQPRHLDVVDLTQTSGDINLLFATLEGLINRKEPRIYLIEGKLEEGKMTWLNEIKVPYKVHKDPWTVLKKYFREVKGTIIYDPELLDTTNVATTLAGLRDGVVVSPELAAKLSAAPYRLPVLEDLRGRFDSALDAYTWQFQNLWSQTTHRMVIGLPPAASVDIPPGNWDSFETVLAETEEIRDGSNRDVYDVDLSAFLGNEAAYLRFQDAFSVGGWGPSVRQITIEADGQVIAQFTPCTAGEADYIFDHGGSACNTNPDDTHRFADGGSYFVYRFEVPTGAQQLTAAIDVGNQFLVTASAEGPLVSSDQKEPYGFLHDYAVANRAMVSWFDMGNPDEVALFDQILSTVEPGTPYLGWFNNEPEGVKLVSSHGLYILPSDWFNNLTVFSGVRAPTLKEKSVPAPPLENKIYLTMTVGEGDNLQYNQHFMRQSWADPARGSVPINWTINPLLIEAAPFMLNYYQRTATNNDMLMAGPSGASYFYPAYWPQDHLATHFEQSASYLRRSGFEYVNVIDLAFPLPAPVTQAYQDQMGVKGIVYTGSTTSTETTMVDNLPVSLQLFFSSRSDVAAIQQQAADWDGNSPLFLSVVLHGWADPAADAAYIMEQLGPEYVPVRADQYFELFREANGA